MDAVPRTTIAALLGLTFATGLVDAASVLGLGHVFVANMTGNVVFMGFALVGEGAATFEAGALALGAFLLGALGAGRITASGSLARARGGFMLELALFAVASGLSFSPSGGARTHGLIALLALAMGLRNALVRKLAVPDLTTTVLTLTLTGLAADSSLAGGKNPRLGRRLASVACMLAGAALGGLMLTHAARWLIPLAFGVEAVCVATLVWALGAAPELTRERG